MSNKTADNNRIKRRRQKLKKLSAALLAVLIAVAQVVVFLPEISFAGGGNLEIRVQYAAEPGAKIRTKATLTRSELAAMSSTYRYSNVTSVGTVMVMKASGPTMTRVLGAADIDVNSVKYITFVTDDGYTRNFTRNQITGSGYYYPKLNLFGAEEDEEEDEENTEPTDSSEPDQPDQPTEPVTPTKPPETEPKPEEPSDDGASLWNRVTAFACPAAYGAQDDGFYKRSDDGRSLVPQKGFDKGATTVPAILAVKFGESKVQGTSAGSLSMSTARTYRFCLGQTKLKADKKTSSSDVTSMESAHSISGIDVTLEGHPVDGIKLTVDNTDMVVGSEKIVKATISGDELFGEYLDTTSLTWSSSNKAIATVDQNGVVTIKRIGKVTITATAMDGTTGTITLGGKSGDSSSGGTDKSKDDNKGKDKADSASDNPEKVIEEKNTNAEDKERETKKVRVRSVMAKEIFLGDEIVEPEQIQPQQEEMRPEMSSEAQALSKVDEYDKDVAAGSAIGAIGICGVGAFIRIRRYFWEVK